MKLDARADVHVYLVDSSVDWGRGILERARLANLGSPSLPRPFTTKYTMIGEPASSVGEKRFRHEHPLKGVLHCGRCQQRLRYTVIKRQFGYFYCLTKTDGRRCTRRFTPVTAIDEAIDVLYRTVRLTPGERKSLKSAMRREFETEVQDAGAEEVRLAHQLRRLLRQRDRLLEALYNDTLPGSVIKGEDERLSAEIRTAGDQLKVAQETQRSVSRRRRAACAQAKTLDLGKFRADASPLVQRLVDQACLVRVEAVDHGTGRRNSFGHDHDVRLKRTGQISLTLLASALLASGSLADDSPPPAASKSSGPSLG